MMMLLYNQHYCYCFETLFIGPFYYVKTFQVKMFPEFDIKNILCRAASCKKLIKFQNNLQFIDLFREELNEVSPKDLLILDLQLIIDFGHSYKNAEEALFVLCVYFYICTIYIKLHYITFITIANFFSITYYKESGI